MDKKICPKCKGEMKSGIIGGHLGDGKWISSDSKISEKINAAFNISDKQRVFYYACTSCGFIESYVNWSK